MKCTRRDMILEEALNGLDLEIEEHLAACRECARAVEELREAASLVESFGGAFKQSAHDWVAQGTQSALADVRKASPQRSPYPRLIAAVLAAAAVVLALLPGSTLFRSTPNAEDEGAPPAVVQKAPGPSVRVPVVIAYRDPDGRRHVVAQGTWIRPEGHTDETVELPDELREQLLESINRSFPRPIPLAHGENDADAITL